MREPRSENEGRAPWHVPLALENVPETGQHLDLVANAEVRAGVARMAGLRDLPRLQASFDVTRHGSGLRVQGRVSATVGQTCVVTLEPLANEVEEAIDLVSRTAIRNQARRRGSRRGRAQPGRKLERAGAVDRRHGRSRRARDGVSHPRA